MLDVCAKALVLLDYRLAIEVDVIEPRRSQCRGRPSRAGMAGSTRA
jgi:hypothetical protein